MDLAFILVFLLLGTEILALIIMIVMFTYEKLFPKKDEVHDEYRGPMAE